MQHNSMNDHSQWAGTGNIMMTTLSIVLTFFAKFSNNVMVIIANITVSDIAAVAAVLAALTTAWLNIYKFIQMRRNKKVDP